MAYTIDEVLQNKSIALCKRRTYSEYSFKVGDLSTVVTIRTYKESDDGHYFLK